MLYSTYPPHKNNFSRNDKANFFSSKAEHLAAFKDIIENKEQNKTDY